MSARDWLYATVAGAVLAAPAWAQPPDRGVGSDGVAPAAVDRAEPEPGEAAPEAAEPEPGETAPSLEDAARLSDRSSGTDRGAIGRRTSDSGADNGFSHRSWWPFWQEEEDRERD